MKKTVLPVTALVAALLLCCHATPGHAQNFRTWISATGLDTNAGTGCQASAPCATFGKAVSQVLQGGQVNCLGPAEANNEDTITITQSMTIDCHGTYGGAMIGGGGNGLVINAPGAVVTLRGLTIEGNYDYYHLDYGLIGILISAAAVVSIEDCVIENFGQSGISDQRSGGTGQLFVRNTVVRNNGNVGSGNGGIDIVPGSGATIQVVIDRSQISSNNFGIGGDGRNGGTIRATVKDSVVSGSTANGITVISSGASVAFLLDQTEVTANNVGLFASGSNAAMAARNTSVFNNTTGLEATSGGKVLTYGNNSVTGNPTEGAFTGTAGLQ